MAQLYVDSDEPADNDLLIAAAKDAMFLSNLPLGERIARAAVERGGGLRAAELLSRALLWQGHPVQADAILARFNPDDLDELQLSPVGRSAPVLSVLVTGGRCRRRHTRCWRCCVSACSTPASS